MKTQITDWYESLDLGWIDVLDVLLVLVLLYEGYKLAKGTGANKIFVGILAIVAFWRLVEYLNLSLTASILGSIFNVGVIALFIIFQPEIRRFLQLFTTRNFFERGKKEFSFLHYFLKLFIACNIPANKKSRILYAHSDQLQFNALPRVICCLVRIKHHFYSSIERFFCPLKS